MIVRPRPTVLQLLYILRGSIVPRIYGRVLVIALLSALVVAAHQVRPGLLPAFSTGPFALIGTALSILLGFRNNACYERWWEARRLWGGLVATGRALARQSMILPPADRHRIVSLTIAFGQALVLHLRPAGDDGKFARRLGPEDLAACRASANPPDALLRLLARELAGLRGRGAITDIAWQTLDRTVGEMGAAQAACERLRTTPVPFAYTLLVHRTAYLFCALLPFGFADALGWGTPLIAALVAYTFFGLDVLGDELEQPFELAPNATPIAALADTMERNLREALGEADLPPLPAPEDYVLL